MAAVVSCLVLLRILNVSFRFFMVRVWFVKSLSMALFMVYNLLLGPDFVFLGLYLVLNFVNSHFPTTNLDCGSLQVHSLTTFIVAPCIL